MPLNPNLAPFTAPFTAHCPSHLSTTIYGHVRTGRIVLVLSEDVAFLYCKLTPTPYSHPDDAVYLTNHR